MGKGCRLTAVEDDDEGLGVDGGSALVIGGGDGVLVEVRQSEAISVVVVLVLGDDRCKRGEHGEARVSCGCTDIRVISGRRLRCCLGDETLSKGCARTEYSD